MGNSKSSLPKLRGYVPSSVWWKDVVLRVVGNPNTIRRLQAPVLMKMLAPQKSDVVLDIGCGGGCFTYDISGTCESVGIDLKVTDNLAYAASESDAMSCVRADAKRMPFAREVFDRLLLSSVLQMVDDDNALLRECWRVLKDDGVLVLSVPVGYIYMNRLNSQRKELVLRFGSKGKGFYSIEELKDLIEKNNFELIDAEYSPKKIGSLIYEISLWFCLRFGLPLFTPVYFFVQFPFAYFDRFARKTQPGNELVVKVKKVGI